MKKDFGKVSNAVLTVAVFAACLFVFTGIAAAQGGEIVSADYGAGSSRVDVTARVQSLAQNGTLNFRVSNDALGGDPAPNHVKELHIRVRGQNGRIRDYRFQEKDTVYLTLDNGGDTRDGRGDGRLRIISARYGAGQSWRDVTRRLQNLVSNNRVNVKVNDTNMGGNPAGDRRKELRIEWEYRGRRQESVLREGDYLNLPGSDSDDDRDRDYRELRITRARYGAGDRWLDVTNTLQNLVSSNRLNIKVNNTNMGGDPAEGQQKELEIEWAYRGRRQESRLREGEYLNLPGSDGDSNDRDHYGDLRIVRARYGTGNRWLDVTNTLQNLARNNRLNIKVNDTNMGGNPAGAQQKELIIEWEFQGQRRELRLPEGEYINIP